MPKSNSFFIFTLHQQLMSIFILISSRTPHPRHILSCSSFLF
jgi:hypothetical protein